MINSFNISESSKDWSLPCVGTALNLTVVPVKFEEKTFADCAPDAVWFVPNIDVPPISKNKIAIIKSFILLFISYLSVWN